MSEKALRGGKIENASDWAFSNQHLHLAMEESRAVCMAGRYSVSRGGLMRAVAKKCSCGAEASGINR